MLPVDILQTQYLMTYVGMVSHDNVGISLFDYYLNYLGIFDCYIQNVYFFKYEEKVLFMKLMSVMQIKVNMS